MKRFKIDYLFHVLLLFSIVLIIFSVKTFLVDNVRIDNEDVVTFNENWICHTSGTDDKTVTLPYELPLPPSDTVTIKNQIPNHLIGQTLAFRTIDQFLRVFIDDAEIYSFGINDKRPFGKSPGSAWHLIRIPTDMSDGLIKIELSSPYAYRSGELPSIYAGTKSAFVFYLFRNHIFDFIICCIILLFGVRLMATPHIIRRLKVNTRNLLYLGIFSILMALASMIETGILQFFIGNQSIFSFSIYVLHLLAPISMILYLSESYLSGMKRIYHKIAYLFAGNYIINIGLHILNIAELSDTLWIYHVLLFLTILFIFYSMVKLLPTYKWNFQLICFCFAQIVFLSSIFIDLICFYTTTPSDVTLFQRLGLLFYIVILCFLDLRNVMALMKQGTEAENLRHLAYEDVLTKCKNRFYFEEYLSDVEKEIPHKLHIGIAIFDVNNLKKINDYKGHSEGDSMLVRAAGFINKYFSNYAKVCRIGGDEFAFIVTDVPPFQLERIFRRFNQAMLEEKSSVEISFDIAFGYAYFNPDIDKNLQETFQRADSNMYDCKKKMKDV